MQDWKKPHCKVGSPFSERNNPRREGVLGWEIFICFFFTFFIFSLPFSAQQTKKVYAVEVETGAPLAPSLAAGKPVSVPYTSSWIDGMGSGQVLAEIWPFLRDWVEASLVVSVDEVAMAVKKLVGECSVVAEGSGLFSSCPFLFLSFSILCFLCLYLGLTIHTTTGAGAAPLAAITKYQATLQKMGARKVVGVVSGGRISTTTLAGLLGETEER